MLALIRRLRGLAGPLLFLLSISLFAGCYTALQHPATRDLTGEPISRDKSCYDCHDEEAFYYHHYGVYYDYYDTPWFGYYSDPWWFRSGWYHGGPSSPEPLDTDTRRSWSRGAPTGSARGAGSPTGPAYLKPGYSGSSAKKPTEQKKEGKKEEKDKSRRTYKRGKKK